VIDKILEERGSRYGEYAKVAVVSQDIKAAIHEGIIASGKEETDIPDYIWESTDMIANKLARAVSGDCMYEDNWIDIIGYAQLVLNEIKEVKEKECSNG